MGGHSSRPQASATELLKYACDVAISSNAACISQAQATIVINITGAANVTFKNDNFSAVASASEDCSQSVNINVPSMQNQVEQAVKQLAGTTIDSSSASVTKLSTTVAKAMNQDNVQKAIADALDTFKITLKASGNVDVANFNVSQVATSNLNNVVQNMSVNGDGTSLVKDVQNQLDEAMAQAPPCPSSSSSNLYSQNIHYASYTGLVIVFILLICSFVLLKKA